VLSIAYHPLWTVSVYSVSQPIAPDESENIRCMYRELHGRVPGTHRATSAGLFYVSPPSLLRRCPDCCLKFGHCDDVDGLQLQQHKTHVPASRALCQRAMATHTDYYVWGASELPQRGLGHRWSRNCIWCILAVISGNLVTAVLV